MTPPAPTQSNTGPPCIVPPGLLPLEPRLLFSASGLPAEVLGLDADAFDAVSLFTAALPEAGTANTSSDGGALRSGGFSLADVPALHSHPHATQSIYLDFNGMTVDNTLWNTNHHGGDTIHAPAFDLDGDITTFSVQELAQITEVWQRVAEDFAPFDLDVTTVSPPAGDFSEGSRAIRVLISSNIDHADLGGDGSAWYADAGGVARRHSWRYESDTPAWVFSNLLLGSAKNVAEAVSHEAGHTFGLSHDGTDEGDEYYTGHGSGTTSWGTIMGSAYNPNVTQWSRGEYDHADNTQDDLAIITQPSNEVAFRADDHADQRANATVILPLFGGRSVGVSGLVATASDIDYFTFETEEGAVDLTINPAAYGANLDILARLYDDTGDLVATSNPSSRLDASFELSLEAGRYYVSVEGTGVGDPGDSGYSDYASLGQYHLVGSIQPVETPQLPPPIAGDLDGDFVVGSGDLSQVIADFGQQGAGLAGDANDDGWVNATDLDLVLAHWGDAVPVPTDGRSRFFVPTDGALALDWVEPGFDDAAWTLVSPAIGYETSGNDYAPLLTTDLPDGTIGAYLRSTFQADDPETLDGLGLSIRYDDGFIAYLNGVRVASHNAPDDPAWDDRATDSHDDELAVRFAWFDLSAHLDLLQEGSNTLAIHLMNRSPTSSDLLLEAEVVAWSRLAFAAPASAPSGAAETAGEGPDPAAAPAPYGPAATDADAMNKHAMSVWSRRNTIDALGPPKAQPASAKRGTAITPRHVADLLR